MFGPGEYRPDPSAGITAPADLPQPEIVPYSRNDLRHPCPHCSHSAYRLSRYIGEISYARSISPL